MGVFGRIEFQTTSTQVWAVWVCQLHSQMYIYTANASSHLACLWFCVYILMFRIQDSKQPPSKHPLHHGGREGIHTTIPIPVTVYLHCLPQTHTHGEVRIPFSLHHHFKTVTGVLRCMKDRAHNFCDLEFREQELRHRYLLE